MQMICNSVICALYKLIQLLAAQKGQKKTTLKGSFVFPSVDFLELSLIISLKIKMAPVVGLEPTT